MKVQEKVISLVSWMAQIPSRHICPTTSLTDDLNLDNIDMLSLILQVERSFGVEFTNEEVVQIDMIKDLTHFVARHQTALAA